MSLPKPPTVLVTGAAGGIGLACVEAFLANGANVVMADVNETGRALADSLDPQRCLFIQTDISDEPAVQRLIDQTLQRYGSLDVLVNNAAILWPTKPLQETSNVELDALLAVNVRGLFYCCKHAYEPLKRSRGCVVNVSSLSGVIGEKHHAAYAMTKGAMNALTMSMAVDWGGEGIRVNAVAPASVLTPHVDRVIEKLPNAAEIVELRKKVSPLGFTALPQQIASVVVFLASPAASFMTGAIVPVSGGTECGYGIKY